MAMNPIDRRTLIKTAGFAAAAGLTMPWVKRAYADEKVLYVNTWGGSWEAAARKNLFDPFTEKTGIEIRTVSPVSFAKLAAQVRTGTYEFDVTTLGVVELGRANNADLVAKADGKVSEADLFPGALVANGVASHSFGNAIVYRTDVYANGGPKNWKEFWDAEAFPGERCLQRYAGRVLGMALMADGVDPKDLFPYDLDRAFASLDKIKDRVSVWWTQGPQATQIIRDNQVPAIGMWPAYAQTAINDGAPAFIEWNQALVDTAYWVVAKDTPRAEAGWEFIKFAVQPERVARFAYESGTGPTNPKGFDYLTADEAKLAVTSPAYKDKVVFFDVEKITPQIDEIQKRFDEWIGQ